MPHYRGSCHCAAITFEIDALIERVTQCNCSVCTKKGILHFRVPPNDFRLVSGEAELGTYRFGTGVAKHHFCTVCGIHVFTRPRAAPELYTVNVRCLDDYDLEKERPEIVPFDGRNFEAQVDTLNAPAPR
ncbi:MAG: hypothetical protein JWQ73_718 [Variovorax sp.]|jgi:hypothetical protein|nr:hypothetical protein [Variovorax sp.]